ncbi:MAG: alpha/beta hydrolase [Actinomycetota bacterium]|nr:alpha/beta hydrolase [Actinomycetota bacterium]
MRDATAGVTAPYAALAVPVRGGVLHVGRWGKGESVVLAAHGTTATHRSLRLVAEQLGEGITILAPDLRGRGRSNAVAGPFSMTAHADDLVAVLDHVGAERALVLGHSMGGFVAAIMAHRHPDRVSGLVLVDGGLPLDLGPLAGRPVEEIVAAVIGPAIERLSMTFPSNGAYFDYWRAHPALGDDWNAHMEDAFAYDLEGEPPVLRSGVRQAAVLADSETQLVGDDIPRALDALRHPAVLVRARRGMLGREPPLYADDWTAQWQRRLGGLRSVVVPDVNHYTVMFTYRGAKAVSEIIHREMRDAQNVPFRPNG